jgi:hypothetical protein
VYDSLICQLFKSIFQVYFWYTNRMLDELGNEIEITDSRLDTTLKKISRVLHLSNGYYNKWKDL